MSYTARDGGDIFREAVNAQLESALNDLNTLLGVEGVTFCRLVSLRQEFSPDWNRFLSPGEGASQQITVNLSKRLFPDTSTTSGRRPAQEAETQPDYLEDHLHYRIPQPEECHAIGCG